jgi:hypothetical protein
MKKRTLVIMAALPFLLGSCVLYSEHYATGNPIGTKIGTMKKARLKKDFATGVAYAAKNGGISKIGSVDLKYYASGKIAVTVTGE